MSIFDPLGMVDTAFSVPGRALDRFGPCSVGGAAPSERRQYDPVDGQWIAPPAFEGGGAGLVSTVGDCLSFARMLLGGGVLDGRRVPVSVATPPVCRDFCASVCAPIDA